MAMPVVSALTKELDAYTPCVVDIGNLDQEKIYRRMTFLIGTILEVARHHFTERQVAKIIEALYYSARKHGGVYRKDGITPYFLHPLEVVLLLIHFKVFDFKIIVAAILHDVVEDTEASLIEIGKIFGASVKNIVDIMTKHPDFVRKWRYWIIMKREPDLNTRWRVILLKYADRIHNLMTLEVVSDESKENKLQETRIEFPTLYEVLKETINRLYKKGTIKNKKYLQLPYILNNRLIYEMGRYT